MTIRRSMNLISRHKLPILILGILFCVLAFGFHNNKVYAKVPDCGIYTGDPTENFEGLLVTMWWTNSSGQQVQADNTWVNVTSYSHNTQAIDNFIDNSNNTGNPDGYSNQNGYSSVNFNQEDYGCTGDGYSVVLGYGDTSQNVSSNGQVGTGAIGAGNGEWYLRCGVDESDPQDFTVKGLGTPTGAIPGGTWTSMTWRGTGGVTDKNGNIINGEGANGATYITKLVYTEPAGIPVSGTVYKWNNTNHSSSGYLSGATVIASSTCTNTGNPISSATTNGSGAYTLNVSKGTTFCLSVTNSSGGTIEISPNSLGPPPSPSVSCNGSTSSYENLVAATGSSGCANDNGYDFAVISSSGCPDQPSVSTKPSVTLPEGSPSGSNLSNQATTSPNANSTQKTPLSDFGITSAGDQYGTAVTWSPTGYSSNSSFTLNYNNYVTAYPYDPHTTTVNYNEEYTQTNWESSSSVSYYTCPGIPSDGATCTTSAPATAATTSTTTPKKTTTCTTTKGKKTCTTKTTYTTTYTTTYSCPSGTIKSGESCITKHQGTAYYDWHVASSYPIYEQFNYTAPALGECLDRTFSLQPSNTSASISTSTSSDLPSSVTVSGDVNSTFGLSGPSTTVHNLCQVSGITTTFFVYYTTPSDPNPQPLPGGSSSQSSTFASSPSACSGTETTPVSAIISTGIPPLAYGDTVCASLSVTPTGDYMNYDGQITYGNGNLKPGGNGTTAIDPSGAPYSFTNCTSPLGAEPYFKSIDGDVMAGLDSDDVSACYDTTAGIYSWSQAGNGSIGAGTTAAALATGSVGQFASGQNILNMLNPPPLTLANSPSTEYGGNYGEGGNCGGPDFYSLAQGITGAVTCPSVIDNQTVPFAGSGQTINVGLGDKYICYSTNNVTIASNITYTQPPPGTPAEDLPVFEVVVKGANINIDTPFNQASGNSGSGPVTQLFGNFVAEINNGQGGTINDTNGSLDVCSAGAPGAYDDTNNSCSNDRLVIDGSFTANQLDLYRTYGTLHDANTSTTYGNNGSDPFDAEEFDYGPINWLVPGASNLTIQSITSLPPVL